MAITVYKSTDTSAPTLTGQAGSLITLLDAVLVNGYGSKSAAGWTKAYSGTNKAAYRLGAGTQHYMRVIDDGTTSAAYARVVGYETMSDVDTGTNPMPSAAQQSGGLYLHKSSTADSTARPWMIVACDRAIYIFIEHSSTVLGSTPAAAHAGYFFGDVKSYKTGDAYQCGTMLSISSSASSPSIIGAVGFNTTWGALGGHYVSRAYTQTGNAIAVAKMVARTAHGASVLGQNSQYQYPDPVTGALDLSPALLTEPGTGSTGVTRGQYPGLFEPLHNLPGNVYDTLSGSGALAGVTFILVNAWSASTAGRGVLQTSGSWY